MDQLLHDCCSADLLTNPTNHGAASCFPFLSVSPSFFSITLRSRERTPSYHLNNTICALNIYSSQCHSCPLRGTNEENLPKKITLDNRAAIAGPCRAHPRQPHPMEEGGCFLRHLPINLSVAGPNLLSLAEPVELRPYTPIEYI